MVSDHIDLGFAMVLFVFGGKSWENPKEIEKDDWEEHAEICGISSW